MRRAETSKPSVTRTATPIPALSALAAAVALVILPMANLPSFDVPKLVLLVLGLAAIHVTTARRRETGARDGALADPILAIPLALAVIAAIGAIVTGPRGSLVGPVTALACIAAARLVAQAADPAAAVRTIARGVAIAALAAGLYGVLQKAGLDVTPWASRREPVATFGNTSFAAEFQAAALPFSLLLALRRDSGLVDRVLGGSAALAGIVHVGIALSRTDYVAAAAGLGAAACLLLHARGRRRAAAGLAAAGVVAGVALGFAFVAAARGDGPSWLGRSDTMAVRTGIWSATTRMIADAPVRVAGTPFVDAFPAWREADEFRISLGRRVETPHHDWLEIAFALGVPGLLAALGVVVLLAKRLVATASTHAAESAALGGSLAALAVSALASSPLSHPATALLPALAAGLVVALAPRPLRGATLPARRTDVAFAVALGATLVGGPTLSTLRSDGFLALGRTELDARNPARALALLDAAAAADSQAADARFELGSLLRSAGRSDEAIAALESARAIRPGDLNYRVNLAYALRAAGRSDDAAKMVEDGLAQCAFHPLLLAARAIFIAEKGRDAEALAEVRLAVKMLPGDPRLRALAAEMALPRAPSPTAEPPDVIRIDESVFAAPAAREAALDALLGLHAAHETEELGRSARSMLRRDPGLLGPLVTRARRLAATRPDDAAALMLAAATAVKDDAGFLDEAAQVLRETGRAEESTILLGRSLGVRAAEAFVLGLDSKALKLAGQAAERDPSPAHFLMVARAAARLGERDAAVESIGAAVAAGPVDPDEVRRDPDLATLLPNRRLEEVLERAARRTGENRTKAGNRR